MATNPEALAHLNLGKQLQSQLRFDEAMASYRAALALDPALAEANFHLGVILQKLRKWDEAAACYLAVLRAKPDSAETFNNLGAVYKSQGKLAAAIECFQQGLQYRPDYVDVLANLGEVFAMQGRRAESMICYEQSLRMRPNFAQAHWNRALALLAEGDFEEGWPEYEWRWECPDLPRHALAGPEWDGGPLDGNALLVHAEQGLGDTLQFVRYLPRLAGLGGPIALRVQTPLVPLITQSGFQNLFAAGAPLPHYDVQIPLLSLPGKLGTTLETIPSQVPYLAAGAGLVSHWRDALSGIAGLKVGIAWQGSAEHQTDHLRSMPLAQFAALAQPGVSLISLQKGLGSEQLSAAQFPVRDLGDELDSGHGALMDAAAIMMSLDLVVTCDTAITHLAGALAVPVWVALPFAPDWRWLLDRDDSPWYPTMRLFRQPSFGDWPPVFERMAEELRRAASQNH